MKLIYAFNKLIILCIYVIITIFTIKFPNNLYCTNFSTLVEVFTWVGMALLWILVFNKMFQLDKFDIKLLNQLKDIPEDKWVNFKKEYFGSNYGVSKVKLILDKVFCIFGICFAILIWILGNKSFSIGLFLFFIARLVFTSMLMDVLKIEEERKKIEIQGTYKLVSLSEDNVSIEDKADKTDKTSEEFKKNHEILEEF